MSTGIAKGRTLGCGALQAGDIRLFEDGGERKGALGLDQVALETVSKGRSRDGERAGCHVVIMKTKAIWDVDRKLCWSGFDIAAHLSDVSATAEGSSLLSTIAPCTPTPFCRRLSSMMLLSRSKTSGIPQKSAIAACLNTTVARSLAALPVKLLKQTLCHGVAHSIGTGGTQRKGWAQERLKEVGCQSIRLLVKGQKRERIQKEGWALLKFLIAPFFDTSNASSFASPTLRS